MNIQHSSRTDCWYTPLDIIERSRRVLGTIDLDPASDEIGNARVQASNILTKEDNALVTPWNVSGSVFLNPPGGKIQNKSLTSLFWQKLMRHRASGRMTHGIFLAFSIEALQTTQKHVPSLGQFIFCVPKKRIAFDHPDGSRGAAPSHSNVIAYIPGTEDNRAEFIRQFSEIGLIVNKSEVMPLLG